MYSAHAAFAYSTSRQHATQVYHYSCLKAFQLQRVQTLPAESASCRQHLLKCVQLLCALDRQACSYMVVHDHTSHVDNYTSWVIPKGVCKQGMYQQGHAAICRQRLKSSSWPALHCTVRFRGRLGGGGRGWGKGSWQGLEAHYRGRQGIVQCQLRQQYTSKGSNPMKAPKQNQNNTRYNT